ncbi:MAG TPA: 4Fe-4S binding protein [Candidatus Binataceae bacterium]|jgi:NADH-quinone oxidoreductase subunit I/NAD(P)H-quinone oxidoreductase subunit I|nr:4Fe-4S binding protein [Candidatus Binataceae bacterium]
MGAASEYFRNIKDAVFTIFDGMAVSASHLIRRPYTIQYPDRTPVRVQDMLPFRYRGILDVDLEICTGCLACERACPIDCIVIVCEKNAQTRELTISQFDIDIAKCMYCGLCSEPCPTGSIHHTTEFEGADFSLESLIRRYVPEPVVAYKVKKGPEPDTHVGQLLERGMRYVDEWAQPGSDKPPAAAGAAAKAAAPAAAARPAPPAAGAAAAAKPAAAAPAATSPVAAPAAQRATTAAAPNPEAGGSAGAGAPAAGPRKDEPA